LEVPEVFVVFEVLGTAMRLGPGSRELGTGGLMEDDRPRGFFIGLVVADVVWTRTLWGPWIFDSGIVDVEAIREAGLSLA